MGRRHPSESDVDGPQVDSVFEEYDLDLDDLIQSGGPAARRETGTVPGGRSGVRTTSLQGRRSSGLVEGEDDVARPWVEPGT